jgi:transposase
MRRPLFKPWIVLIPSCRSRRDAPTPQLRVLPPRHALLNLQPSIPPPVASTAKPLSATPAASSSPFLQGVVCLCPPRQQIHIILDNLSVHKTQAVHKFLQQHPRVRFHFTPTYSSWLNRVEIWFAKIEREVIARGIFTSVSDLGRKLRCYNNAYSANARPIQGKYSDPTCRLRSNEITATGHQSISDGFKQRRQPGDDRF